MRRLLLVALLAGCSGSSTPRVPVKETSNTADYEITFVGMWSDESHPHEYPKGTGVKRPQFLGLIGVTHNDQYTLFRDGQNASPGLEKLAEEGRLSPLNSEIKDAIAEGKAGRLLDPGYAVDATRSVTFKFKIDDNHPKVSFVIKIFPSPDWFTGFADLTLWENGAWAAERILLVAAWDAGTDDGATYEAADAEAKPKKPVRQCDTAHFMRDGAPTHVAKFILKKKD